MDKAKRTAELVMSKLDTWFKNNGLEMNVSKTAIVPFNANPRYPIEKFNTNFGNSVLESGHNTKFLGIDITDGMKWNSYLENLTKKLNSSIFSLRIISRNTDLETRLAVYHGYFMPHLRYGILFWAGSSMSETIFRKQKAAVRIIAELPGRSSCRPLFTKYRLLTVPALAFIELATFVKKNDILFAKHKICHNLNTRHRDMMYFPNHKTLLFEKGPSYMGIRIFNSLPKFMKAEKNLNRFVNVLKKILTEECPYSLAQCMEVVGSKLVDCK